MSYSHGLENGSAHCVVLGSIRLTCLPAPILKHSIPQSVWGTLQVGTGIWCRPIQTTIAPYSIACVRLWTIWDIWGLNHLGRTFACYLRNSRKIVAEALRCISTSYPMANAA